MHGMEREFRAQQGCAETVRVNVPKRTSQKFNFLFYPWADSKERGRVSTPKRGGGCNF